MLCPKCGKKIHALKKSHDCGWIKEESSSFPPTINNAEFSLTDIVDVKRLMDRVGQDQFKQLVSIF